MIIIENVPLFRTKAPVAVDAVATAPPTTKSPLPAELWVTGIATFAEARRVQRSFTGRYVTHCGRGDAGFYVAGPNSGLCAVVPHTAIADHNEDEFSLTFEAVQP